MLAICECVTVCNILFLANNNMTSLYLSLLTVYLQHLVQAQEVRHVGGYLGFCDALSCGISNFQRFRDRLGDGMPLSLQRSSV